MNTPASLRRPWSAVVALTLSCLASVLTLSAQPAGTGVVQGRVFNPTTKEYIRNAEVRLEGSTQTVYTENDGSFQFLNVPAGSATVSVVYSGYAPAKDTFTVTAGQTAVREINMSYAGDTSTSDKGVVKLEAFSVSTTREGNAKAVQAQ